MEKDNNISVDADSQEEAKGSRPKVNKEYMSITSWDKVVQFYVAIQGKSGEINHMYNIPTYKTLFMIPSWKLNPSRYWGELVFEKHRVSVAPMKTEFEAKGSRSSWGEHCSLRNLDHTENRC